MFIPKAFCPAQISVQEDSSGLFVKHYSLHLNHNIKFSNVQFHRPPCETMVFIKCKLAQNVDREAIFCDVRRRFGWNKILRGKILVITLHISLKMQYIEPNTPSLN